MQGRDLIAMHGACDVIGLDVVDAPFGVQPEQRIVVVLGARTAHVHSVHVAVPRADRVDVRDFGGAGPAAGDGQILAHRLPRYTAHDVNAELQSESVNIIGE